MNRRVFFVGCIAITLLVIAVLLRKERPAPEPPVPQSIKSADLMPVPVKPKPPKAVITEAPQKKVNRTKTQPAASHTPAQTVVRSTEPGKVTSEAKKLGIQVVSVSSLPFNDALVTLARPTTDPLLVRLAANIPGVKLSPNYTYRAFMIPNDTNFSEQWNLAKISAPAAWDISTGNSDTTIAIIDTGVLFNQQWGTHNYSQPDFPNSKKWINTAENANNGIDDDNNGLIDDWQGWDFMGGYRGPSSNCPNLNDPITYQDPADATYLTEDNDPQPYSCDSPFAKTELNKSHFNGTCDIWESACFVGHGTSVASVAAAASNNSQLIAGVDYNAKIMSLRVLDGYGYSDSARITAAIEYAAAEGADVINLSLGLFSGLNDCTGTDAGMEIALQSAYAAGAIVIGAAGNTGGVGVCYPARSAYAIAVGASNSSDQRASFSSFGAELDVLAPGESVPTINAPSTATNSNYRLASGTSFSAPHIAGAAALLKSQRPSAVLGTINNMLATTSDRVPEMLGRYFSSQHGYGRVNLFNALRTNSGIYRPVFRFYKIGSQDRLLTINYAERDRLIVSGYKYEGVSFWAISSTVPGSKAVYRLVHSARRERLLTTSPGTRDDAKRNGFTYEGIAFYATADSSLGSKPVLSLFNPATYRRFYTTSTAERDDAKRNGYKQEGIAFWALTK